MNWFAATNFRGQVLSTPVFHYSYTAIAKYWFKSENICNNEALAKISLTRNKVGLQYTNLLNSCRIQYEMYLNDFNIHVCIRNATNNSNGTFGT